MNRLVLMLIACALLAVAAAPASALEADKVFEKVSPSVWVVLTSDAGGRMVSQGSAVVIGPGRLVTNCHVLVKAKAVFVRRKNVLYQGKLEHADAPRDLCLLSVEDFNAPAVTIAPRESVKVGEKVFAIGNPVGLEATLSEGLISGLRGEWPDGSHVLQTTAPISPGSSGGGLFDSEGRLVGITRSSLVGGGAENLNFALPANWIAEVPARAEAALAKRKEPAPGSPMAAAGAPAGYPASGTTWIYRFSELMFAKRTAKVAIRADHVDHDLVEESVYRPDADAAVVRRSVRTGDARFLYYPVVGDSKFLEFAPYLLAATEGKAPAATFVPVGYVASGYQSGTAPQQWDTTVRRFDWAELTVPAGTYRAVHYEITGKRLAGGRNIVAPAFYLEQNHFQVDVWYSPDVERIAKVEFRTWSGGAKLDDDVIELLEYRPPR